MNTVLWLNDRRKGGLAAKGCTQINSYLAQMGIGRSILAARGFVSIEQIAISCQPGILISIVQGAAIAQQNTQACTINFPIGSSISRNETHHRNTGLRQVDIIGRSAQSGCSLGISHAKEK